jgi:hypothetical protein
VIDDRPDLVRNYADAMTRLLAAILRDGVQQGEYRIEDVDTASEVVRDAVTVYVYPALVEAPAKAGISMEPSIKRMMATLIAAFRAGV